MDKIEDCGYIYLVRPDKFCILNIDINKAGMTKERDLFHRINKYGFGSELYTYFFVKNVTQNEKDIMKLLRNDTNNNKNIQKIFGDEYFFLNYQYMLNIIKNVIKNDIIYVMDINEDVKKYRHNKIFVYYDETFNIEIYDKFN